MQIDFNHSHLNKHRLLEIENFLNKRNDERQRKEEKSCQQAAALIRMLLKLPSINFFTALQELA